MSKKSITNSLRVEKPCTQPWEEMTGNDSVRFCGHCAKDVNFISTMTRKDARRLAKRSGGNLCVRYVTKAGSNKPLFADQLIQISRRAPRLAAGLIGATLGLGSMTYAQSESTPPPAEISQPNNDDEKRSGEIERTGKASLGGMLVDPNGAVVPGVKIIVRDERTNATLEVTSRGDGGFTAENLPPGRYHLSIKAGAGFAVKEVYGIQIANDTAQDFRVLTLEPQQLVFMSGGISISEERNVKRTTLGSAVYSEEYEEVRELLVKGEDPDLADEDGNTPLFTAVEDGSFDIVRLLLEFRADADHRNKKGENPLFEIDNETPAELVKLLIDAGADVNADDEKGVTLLHYAAENATAAVVKLLIDAGANVNKTDNEGWTPLMRAAYEDDLEKVRALLFAGADVKARNKDGENAWDQTTDEKVEALLVSFGSEVSDEQEDDSVPTSD